MPKARIKVGIVGLGMGAMHLEDYCRNPLCEVTAIADINMERLNQFRDKYHIVNCYTNEKEMFEKCSLDAVSLATPNYLHCNMTLAALKRGLHVLCEKPMAMNLEQGQKMKSAALKTGKNLMINMSFRFNDMSFALKQQVEAGVIGSIYFGRTVWHRRRGIPGVSFGDDNQSWFSDKQRAGGGPLIDLGVHRLDLALWLMGYPKVKSVSGCTYNVIAARKAGPDYNVEDLACGMIRFTNGATLILEASWALNIQEQEYMVTCLYGDKGGLSQKNLDSGYNFAAELYLEEVGNLYTKKLDRACVKAPSAYQEFINSIAEKRKPLVKLDEALEVQKILDGLYASASQGREIVF